MKVRCKGKVEMYGQTYHCWKEKGHGYMRLKNAIKQSCDIYFYEVSRLLGVDRLNETARKFGLGDIVLKNFFDNEKKGVVPSTKWKKEAIGQNWYLGETLITLTEKTFTISNWCFICDDNSLITKTESIKLLPMPFDATKLS